jgi:mannose-6-phosphate isomerase
MADTAAEAPDARRFVTVSDRPWGRFDQLTLNEPSTVKIITIAAGKRLSLQRHEQRDELWLVLDGPVRVTLDDETRDVAAGELVWVPRRAAHRMAAPGATDARVLEVAFGWFDEDDIARLSDDYGRPSP